MVDLQRCAEGILRRALANGGDLAEIYLEDKAHTVIAYEEGKAERIISGSEAGAGIRVIAGERSLYAHTNDITETGLGAAADTVAAGLGLSQGAYSFDFNPERYEMPVAKSRETMTTPEKVAMVAAADEAARAYDRRVSQVSISLLDSTRRVVIVNSDGCFVEDIRPQTVFMVRVMASSDGVIQTGMRPVGGRVGLELFDDNPPEELAVAAARQACLMLEADPAPTGPMPVVISSEAGGTMVHEAVGHGLEADAVDKKVSKYEGRLGEMIAAPIVTVIDDGTLVGKRGTCSVDDEGTLTQRTTLIDQGRLVSFMTDLRTARKMGMKPTGNGRRESYQHRPVPRMTNTLIAPGKSDPASILAGTDRGLFVRRMGGGQVNPLNGEYVFEVSEGYLIKNGKLDRPVRGATLIGDGPTTLRDIEEVGNDLGYAIGTCGKSGQGVPVSDAQPTLRIRALTIGGTAG